MLRFFYSMICMIFTGQALAALRLLSNSSSRTFTFQNPFLSIASSNTLLPSFLLIRQRCGANSTQ